MIILCPDCSKPYELPDSQVSALVRVACPHCSHAVILDFEAANDPSLREEGHSLTHGFRSREQYLQSLGGEHAQTAANHAPPPPQESPAPPMPSPRIQEEAKTPSAPKAPSKAAIPAPKISAPAPAAPLPAVPLKTPTPARAKPQPDAATPARKSQGQAPSRPQSSPERTPKPPPAHPAPPQLSTPPRKPRRKSPPRPPAPPPVKTSAPAAALAEPSSAARSTGSSAPSRVGGSFPELGPGFGDAAPELPPMADASSSGGQRPATMQFDLNAASEENANYSTPSTRSSSATASGELRLPEQKAASSDALSLFGTEPRKDSAQAPQSPGALSSVSEDDELELAPSGKSWIWWLLAILLLAGGGFFGWSMFQEGQHAGGVMLQESRSVQPE